jgi:undecaprenyl-phosphate 4-deoxy-4-formamido-L-arabinose transferase
MGLVLEPRSAGAAARADSHEFCKHEQIQSTLERMQNNNEIVTLSIVVPVYSGEKYLADLVAEIAGLKSRWESAGVDLLITEAIFVLDAPVDGSAECLANLAQIHPWIRRVDLSRNFGQHSATVAGILYSSGDWVVTSTRIAAPPMAIKCCCNRLARKRPTWCMHNRRNGSWPQLRDLLSRLVKKLIAALRKPLRAILQQFPADTR